MTSTPVKRIYPWEKPTITNADDAYVYRTISEQFDAFQYPREVPKPTNKVFGQKLIEIMDHIDPSSGNAGNWAMIASNNDLWLRDYSFIIPMAYSLTYKLRVHPTDPQKFNMIVRNRYREDDIPYLPFGLDMFKTGSSLIFFDRIGRNSKYMEQFSGNSDEFFYTWLSKPYISVVATTSYTGLFDQAASESLDKRIGNIYGSTARNAFNSKGVLFIAHDESLKTKWSIKR